MQTGLSVACPEVPVGPNAAARRGPRAALRSTAFALLSALVLPIASARAQGSEDGATSPRSGDQSAAAARKAPAPVGPSQEILAEPEAPPAMGLVAVVEAALARNPTAVVAAEEVRRAYGLLEEARSASLPILAATGTYTHLDSDRRLAPTTAGVPGTIVSAADQVNGNITLTVPILAARSWAQWSHAGDAVTVARASEVDVRRAVAIAVARAYLTIVAQRRVIDAARRARDTDRSHYEFAHQRFQGGVGNRIDEVRSNQLLQSDEANLQQQYASLERVREALGVLVGAGGPIDAEEPNLRVPIDHERAMRQAEQRSDVAVAGARLVAADHTVRDDWTDFAPSITGAGSAIYQNPPTLTQPRTGWQILLVLTVPLYDGGLRYGEEKERAALRNEARVTLEGVVRQARSDVRTAFVEIQRADASLDAARRGAELAHQALDLAQIAYRAGAFTDIEVIDAERSARDADTAVAVAEDGARQARLDLLAASGTFP
jgi:outer membrane protein TolC